MTKAQRKDERKLREDVVKKNSELTEDEAGNWIWKVVGRRGERRTVKVSIEKEEGSNQEKSKGRGQGKGRGKGNGQRVLTRSNQVTL